jgi:hypothetical protein
MRDPADGLLQIQTPSGVGLFDNADIAWRAVDGTPMCRVHTRLVSPNKEATNRIDPNRAVVPGTRYTAMVLRCDYKSDEDDIDEYAEIVQANGGLDHVWICRDTNNIYTIRPVVPFDVHDRLEKIEEWMADQTTLSLANKDGWPKQEWHVASNDIPISNGRDVTERPPDRLWTTGAGDHLNPVLPPKLRETLSRGEMKKLWLGTGNLGLDEHGNEREKTPDAYDRELVKRLLTKSKTPWSELTLTKMLVWRKGSEILSSRGYGALRRFVSEIYESTYNLGEMKSVGFVVPQFNDGEPLSDKLYGYYYTQNSNGDIVNRVGIRLIHKAKTVLAWLKHHGAQFYHFKTSQETVFVLDSTPHIVDEKDPEYKKWFLRNVELFDVKSAHGRHLTDSLRTLISSDPETKICNEHHWGYRSGETLYFAFDPNHRQLVRVTPVKGVELVDNGISDVTLRGATLRTRAFTPATHEQVQVGWEEFVKHVHHGQALSPLDRVFSTCWNLVSLLPGHKGRPIKFHYGREGSGKTESARDWGTVVYGGVSDTQYDSLATFVDDLNLGGPCVIHDNAEAKQRRRFESAYHTMTTGGQFQLRVLYTTSSKALFKCNGSIFVTAIEPMQKPEELRRTFEFQFDRKWHGPRLDELARSKLFEEGADRMLSGVLSKMATHVLPGIDDHYAHAAAWIKENAAHLIQSKSGFKSWYVWMLVMARKLGHLLWVPDQRPWDADSMFVEWVKSDEAQYTEARVDSDPILGILAVFRAAAVNNLTTEVNRGWTPTHSLYDVRFSYDPRTGKVVIGPTTTATLWASLSHLAKVKSLHFPYTESRAFSGRMRALLNDPSFAASGWTREVVGKGHNNVQTYNLIWTPSEPPAGDPD